MFYVVLIVKVTFHLKYISLSSNEVEAEVFWGIFILPTKVIHVFVETLSRKPGKPKVFPKRVIQVI